MPIVSLLAQEDLSGLTPLWEVNIDAYRFVLYSGNRVEVYKQDASSPAYTVTEDGCSCKAAQYGNTACKHRSFVRFVGAGGFPGPVSKQTSDDASPEIEYANINDLL